ncbi:hypothetical protein PDIDSM_1078 [Penicillium digitatum]|nr:hypothetical protein PDIDSM_1078 [Penicillium digitatum]
MKAFKLLLFIFLSLFNHGQGSKLAAPSEMLAMYNAYALDFLKNGATRTLGPNLENEALVDFGTFVSHIYTEAKFPRDGVFLSQTPDLFRDVDPLPKTHLLVLDRLSDVVKSTRGSTAPGFSEAWKTHVPEFKRALAGTQGARLSEMFSVGLKPLFEEKYPGTTMRTSSFPVLDTDVSYTYENWGLTLNHNENPAAIAEEYKTWYVGLRHSIKNYLTIGRSLTELGSLDSCD